MLFYYFYHCGSSLDIIVLTINWPYLLPLAEFVVLLFAVLFFDVVTFWLSIVLNVLDIEYNCSCTMSISQKRQISSGIQAWRNIFYKIFYVFDFFRRKYFFYFGLQRRQLHIFIWKRLEDFDVDGVVMGVAIVAVTYVSRWQCFPCGIYCFEVWLLGFLFQWKAIKL